MFKLVKIIKCVSVTSKKIILDDMNFALNPSIESFVAQFFCKGWV